MELIEAVNIIKKAQENNQLVIFVGAGVSKNSGILTWSELVSCIAKSIEYSRDYLCESCKTKSESCNPKDCDKTNDFSQEEFLRIPEYLFQKNKSNGYKGYYDFIESLLVGEFEPNDIDYEIFNLLPHHIITTNFDSLLEDTNNDLVSLYSVVREDGDMLSKSNDRYIIKMHGDLSRPKSLVLKESDYINYEQEHPLISTFIKSLLINHTFLFLGYSLNDYNLNLIIGWINYYQTKYKISERQKSILVSNKINNENEEERLAAKNIYVVDLANEINMNDISFTIPTSLTNSIGKMLYAFLKIADNPSMIIDSYAQKKYLLEKAKILDSYSKIAIEDFIKLYRFGNHEIIGSTLVLYDKEKYNLIESVIKMKDKKIINLLRRVRIDSICQIDGRCCNIVKLKKIFNDSFRLYINNNYVALLESVDNSAAFEEKLYYYHFFSIDKFEIDKIYCDEKKNEVDFIQLLLAKIRKRLMYLSFWDRNEELTDEIRQMIQYVPYEYSNAISLIKIIFNSDDKLIIDMQNLLEKQENRYVKRSGFETGSAHIHLLKMQSIVYDYYYFIKMNYIPIDYFKDVDLIFNYYIRAILCTYISDNGIEDDEFFLETQRKEYVFNEIDWDIIIKYVRTDNLIKWINEYSINRIEISKNIDVTMQFANLCESYVELKNDKWIAHIYNYVVLICLINRDKTFKQTFFSILANTLYKASKISNGMSKNLIDIIVYLSKNIEIQDARFGGNKKIILDVILNKELFNVLLMEKRQSLFFLLKSYSDAQDEKAKNSIIYKIKKIESDKEKIKEIHEKRYLLSRRRFHTYLENNISQMTLREIFDFVVEGRIAYSYEIQKIYDYRIKELVEKRKKEKKVRSYPDHLYIAIEECILLRLLGFKIDLTILNECRGYSKYVDFLIDPDNFNYSKVDIDNYMWVNLICSEEYSSYFINHKKEIITEEFKNKLKNGIATNSQQKIIYGILLDTNELRDY